MNAPRFSYRAVLCDSVRREGTWATTTRLLRGGWELLRDLAPSRRRLRYGDLDFDWEHRVDTTWSNVRLATRLREIFAGRGYQATDPAIFREMMQHVCADLRAFTFLDVGCGKGRALLLARDYDFRRIVGVELLPELVAVARANSARLPAAEQARIEVVAGDALTYGIPPDPLFVYLFDPLPAAALAAFIVTLERSLREQPRSLFIGYQNPVSENVLRASPQLHKIAGTRQWALYKSRTP